jgi:predicted DsbA family dithiol-disulfide isomerase
VVQPGESTLVIEVFADIACPWCYIAERRLERSLQMRPSVPATFRWRPFQLQPQLPQEGVKWDDFVQYKFGGMEKAKSIFSHVARIGAADGIRFEFEKIPVAPNTQKLHRLILLAAEHDRSREMSTTFYKAYFTDGRDLSDDAELVALTTACCDLDPDLITSFLKSDRFVEEVNTSQEIADRAGISGVPFYVFDDRFVRSGAQPTEVFLKALDAVSSPV